ncbi:unnamed protein product [Blepharisma stoltei]|uniref:Mitochondrial import receptor subunit TOM40 n=1 Tax=Blepharisma stoltei TaxID=1481888 RepID=A0AAU9JY55_9CILI|nr:unnamed protein product [Blepharisma stoltei]
MSGHFGKLKDLLFYSNCSTPEPEPTPSDSTKKDAEEPIILDESDNPALIEQQRKHPLRPSSFEALMQPLKIATMVESIDGVKVDVAVGLSQHLQIQNTVVLPNGQGGNYEANFMFVGGQMTNPYDMVTPNPVMVAKVSPGTGRQDIRFITKGNYDMEYRLQAQYASSNINESQVLLEAEKQGEDYVAGVKLGIKGDQFSYNYMQSLHKNLQLGFEVSTMTKPRQSIDFSYGGKFTWGPASYYFQHYAPFQSSNFGAVIKASPNVTYTTEISNMNMERKYEFSGGIGVRFSRAKLNAQITGSGKLSMSITQVINPILRVSFSADADLAKNDQKFGMGVTIGQ